jgi:hypothetical protein
MDQKKEKKKRYSLVQAHPVMSAVILAIVLTAGVLAVIQFWPRTVYVTDGSYVFNDNLRAVEAKILSENEWVDRSGLPYVSIAVVATMSPEPSVEPLDPTRTRHGIEGAYLAQYEANHPSGPHGRPGAPLIKLLLADEGSQEAYWPQVAAQLEARVDSKDHLVAVTGLGISVTNTTKLISALRTGPHPPGMVGSVLTGNEFAGLPGLVLVSPTNSDEAAAAARFLVSGQHLPVKLPSTVKVWLVQDQNSADGYAQSLAATFPRALSSAARKADRHYELVGPGTTFNSSLAYAPTVLAGIGSTVCDHGANVVYFAGRGVDLQGLLTGLAHRYCAAASPLIVLSGSDVSQLDGQGGLWPGSANMYVYYTALAVPAEWSAGQSVVDQATAEWFTRTDYGFPAMFPGESLDDSWAIMFHDGVLAAVTAVDQLYQQTGALPPAGAVANELNQVVVHGASGYICFNAQHDPINKAVAIVQLTSAGQLNYMGLSSARGAAPAGDTCN